jgi:hypothetical protein
MHALHMLACSGFELEPACNRVEQQGAHPLASGLIGFLPPDIGQQVVEVKGRSGACIIRNEKGAKVLRGGLVQKSNFVFER